MRNIGKFEWSRSLFGVRLREARLRAQIPQDKLGVAIGLDETTASARISRYETGVHEPPFGTAALLAKVLDVPTAYFYCESPELAEWVMAWHRLNEADRMRVMSQIEAAQ
jgi:transcriptional regulator with XRE-family HTH domain